MLLKLVQKFGLWLGHQQKVEGQASVPVWRLWYSRTIPLFFGTVNALVVVLQFQPTTEPQLLLDKVVLLFKTEEYFFVFNFALASLLQKVNASARTKLLW